jgi:hypothetical protein
MTEKLKPCKCGKTGTVIDSPMGVRVVCLHCGVKSERWKTKKSAVTDWNRIVAQKPKYEG